MLDAHDDVTDVAVIGAGLAGLAAGAFAVKKGLAVARLGSTGALAYTTGYLDMLGSAGDARASHAADIGAAVARLGAAHREHPYARLAPGELDTAFSEFTELLAAAGLPYVLYKTNVTALSPLGTVKTTRAVPETMAPGIEAFKNKTPCLLVDFKGFKAFSAKGIAAALAEDWPTITPVTVTFPDLQWAGELYAEAAARSLEVAANREALADVIRPHIGGAKCVCLPAILGIYDSASARDHMTELLGVPVFEIPTLPPAVPGIRLRETLDDALRERGMVLFSQRYAFAVRKEAGLFRIDVGESGARVTVTARRLVLATGRFLSGGLVADRVKGIYEPLLGLPVAAPGSREEWHREDFFDPSGHPVNKAGVCVDAGFRPVSADGNVLDPDLYAVGSIVAGQDWIREKSGAGIAVGSAWKAIDAICSRRTREGV